MTKTIEYLKLRKWDLTMNMKKNICYTFLLSFIICVLCSGCAKKNAELSPPENAKEQRIQSDDIIPSSEEPSDEPFPILLYYANDTSDGFLTEVVQLERFEPEQIIEQLAEHGVFPFEVTLLDFEEQITEDSAILLIDLSSDFQDYVTSMGSSREYLTLGCLSNTFLTAYQADRIQLTIEGNPLETGHNEYSNYLEFYE